MVDARAGAFERAMEGRVEGDGGGSVERDK